MTDTPEWLAPSLDYVSRWLEYQMRVLEQPGCTIAVTYRGKLKLEHAIGFADQGLSIPLTPRHRFRVASHSKSFTAAGLMRLREQGRVTLEDRTGQYVSGLHPKIASATIAQLLSHTAGIFRDGMDANYWVDRAPFPDEAELDRDLALPPAIEAGLRLKYSNHGFALAGRVIEAVTGESWVDWIGREIVAKAGLTETTPDAPLPDGAPFARGHSSRTLLGRRLVVPGDQSTNAFAPATGFVATAGDLAKFFAQLSPEAETSILTAASRREMTRAQWRDPHATLETSYGLGMISGTLDGWEWFGHGGGFLGYITRTVVVPKQHLAISVLTNAVDGSAHPWLDGALRIMKAFATGGAPSAHLADWAGRWWSVWAAVDLVPIGQKVFVALPGLLDPLAKTAEIEVNGTDEGRIAEAGAFGSYGEPVRLIRNDAGKVSTVRLGAGTLVPEDVLAAELQARYDLQRPETATPINGSERG
ncbi:serine hydrolase domain-containing protein [Labrys miyagiensis]|nr:serine hydrolase domain-containing protein [Labrys miyagiensis]